MNRRRQKMPKFRKSSVPRQTGPKQVFNYRAPDDILAYVRELERTTGDALNHILSDHISMARAIYERLDLVWVAIELEAKQRQCTESEVVADLLMEAVRQRHPQLLALLTPKAKEPNNKDGSSANSSPSKK